MLLVIDRKKLKLAFTVGASVILLTIGVVAVILVMRQADHQNRLDILQEARLVSKAVNYRRVETLTADKADLGSPDYLRLKEQLADVRQVDPKFRFLYLLGRQANGDIFFYLDSEPAGSDDESLPGEIYTEASDELKNMFDSGEAIVEGPSTDKWGTWVSALVPVFDPNTKKLIAVYGMDVDAALWNRQVLSASLLPMILTLFITISIFFIVSLRRHNLRIKAGEQLIRENEARFRSLFDNMTEGVAIHDIVRDKDGKAIDYRITSVNPAFEKHTGISNAQATGQLATALYKTAKPPYLKEYQAVLQRGGASSFETYFPDLKKDFFISVIALDSERFATVFEDVTARKQSEKILKEKNEKLTETNEELENFTKLVSDREGKMMELKEKIAALEAKLNNKK
jgi:PAS domain S-box-containing protein